MGGATTSNRHKKHKKMNTKTQTFCRTLTAAERKKLAAGGVIDGVFCDAPLLAWRQKSKADTANEIRFFEVSIHSLVQAPMDDYVATVDGIVIAMQTASGIEKLYHFEESEYAEAIDFYNKMQVALEKNNNF